MGWGIAVVPELQVRELVRKRQLLPLRAEVSVDLTLYWHQWKLVSEAAPAPGRVALLDQVGQALSTGARSALKALPGRRKAAGAGAAAQG